MAVTPTQGNSDSAEAARQAAAWVQSLARTLKTWRLYDEQNPTVLQFRSQLTESLCAWLEAHGALTLRFTAETISLGDTVLHRAQSRDDQLSLVFFRDGIQSLTFSPGIERDELDVFLATVVRMSSRGRSEDEDLVTLLWDAELVHLDMHYVAAEADVELESEADAAGSPARHGPPVAWPRASASELAAVAAAGTAVPSGPAGTGEAPATATRSEDWTASDPTLPLHAEFDQIESEASTVVERFLEERSRERAANPRLAMVALIEDALRVGLDDSERLALVPNVTQLLEDGLANGEWADAGRALAALRSCRSAADDEQHWSLLSRPDSVLTRSVVRRLDSQAQPEVAQFLAFAQQVGSRGLDWLIRIMAESQQQRVRRPLARTLAQVVDGRLDRLTQWLDDPRWYVVRNLVTVLHAIGGATVVPALQRVVTHPERRVRLEVIAALGTAPPELTRALLLPMLGTDDPRELSGALRLLAQGPDPELSQLLFSRLLADGFHLRPVEEQRAVLSALAVAADDDAVPLLETCLDPAKRPSPEAETLLQGVARCLARMGSPAARAALQRAMGSHWNLTRDAASMGLTSMRPK